MSERHPGDAARDAERDVWNTALAEHAAGRITDGQLARVRAEVLGTIHLRIMTDDRYQDRTRGETT